MHRDTHEGRPSSLAHWSLREAVFLVLANHLPRLWLLDRYRAAIYRLAGIAVGRGSTIYGPVGVRPYGGCRYVSIGRDTFLNVDTAFTVVYDRVRIGDHVQVGPRVSFETMGHGLLYVPGKGRGRNRQKGASRRERPFFLRGQQQPRDVTTDPSATERSLRSARRRRSRSARSPNCGCAARKEWRRSRAGSG